MVLARWVLAIPLVLSLSLLASAGGNQAEALVGTWELTKGAKQSPVGSTVEFTADGKVKLLVKSPGKEERVEGKYEVKDSTIHMKLNVGDEQLSATSKIKTLTAKALVVENRTGDIEEFKRLK